MKILFIFTGSINITGFDSFGKYDDIDANTIHHGICLLSANAKQHGFSDIELIDLRQCKDWTDFENKLINKEKDVAALSMNSVDFNPVMRAVKLLKSTHPNVKTIVGGIHPSILIDEVKSTPEIDYIVTGEGEISFVDILKNISNNKESPRIIEGVKPDLDSIPFADRGLFDYRETIRHPFTPGGKIDPDLKPPFVTIITGRGCMFNCRFCQPAERILFGSKVRRRSVGNVIDELKLLKKNYQFNSFMIHDDCFLEDIEWVEKFCIEFEKAKIDAKFVCQTRADIVCHHKDLIKKLYDIGLRLFLIGFESGSQRILDFLNKGTTVEENANAAKICKEMRIKIAGNFMLGIPTETAQEMQETIKFIKDIRPEYLNVGFFTPFPGSSLFEYCKKHNLSLIENHDGYIRDNERPKIKGVDYVMARRAWNEAMGISIPRRILKRIRGDIRNNRLEHFLRRFYFFRLFVRFIRQHI